MPRPPKNETSMTPAERTKLSRDARQKQGKRIDVMLSPEGNLALEAVRQSGHVGSNTRDIVEALLIQEAKLMPVKK